MSGSIFQISREGALVRIYKLDGVFQVVVPSSLQPRGFRLAHLSLLCGHSEARGLYDILLQEVYWLHMSLDCYQVVRDCNSCAASIGTIHWDQKHLHIFPARGPLEVVSMDILVPLLKTDKGNQWVLVIKDRFSKLPRTASLKKKTAIMIVQVIFLCGWWLKAFLPMFQRKISVSSSQISLFPSAPS